MFDSTPLFQGLPNDLALLCLLRVPAKFHPALREVSRTWRSVVSSSEFYELRQQLGVADSWLIVVGVTKPFPTFPPLPVILSSMCQGLQACCQNNSSEVKQMQQTDLENGPMPLGHGTDGGALSDFLPWEASTAVAETGSDPLEWRPFQSSLQRQATFRQHTVVEGQGHIILSDSEAPCNHYEGCGAASWPHANNPMGGEGAFKSRGSKFAQFRNCAIGGCTAGCTACSAGALYAENGAGGSRNEASSSGGLEGIGVEGEVLKMATWSEGEPKSSRGPAPLLPHQPHCDRGRMLPVNGLRGGGDDAEFGSGEESPGSSTAAEAAEFCAWQLQDNYHREYETEAGQILRVHVFDLRTATWLGGHLEVPHEIQGNCYRFGAAVLKGRLLLFGGGNPDSGVSDLVWEWNPRTGQWKKLACMPSKKSGMASGTVGDRLLVIGGWDSATLLASCSVYDGLHDSWHPAASMAEPHDFDRSKGVVVGGILYARCSECGEVIGYAVHSPSSRDNAASVLPTPEVENVMVKAMASLRGDHAWLGDHLYGIDYDDCHLKVFDREKGVWEDVLGECVVAPVPDFSQLLPQLVSLAGRLYILGEEKFTIKKVEFGTQPEARSSAWPGVAVLPVGGCNGDFQIVPHTARRVFTWSSLGLEI